jgi:hypothetical protein
MWLTDQCSRRQCRTESGTAGTPFLAGSNWACSLTEKRYPSWVLLFATLLFLYLILNNTVPDFPPPGGGLSTVTRAVPAEAMSNAGMSAMSWVLLTHRVVRSDPFHCTVEWRKRVGVESTCKRIFN